MHALTCSTDTHYSCDFARLQLTPHIVQYLSFAILVILLMHLVLEQ